MWWPTAAFGFGIWIWNIVADRFATATGVLDFYHASQHLWDLAHTLHPENDAGARAWVERCCTSCGTAAKPGCCKPCRICRPGARNERRPCRRTRPKKSTALKTTGRISSMPHGQQKVVPSAAAPWNHCASNCKAASNTGVSSGPNPAAAASWPSKSPAATKIGMKSGSQIKNNVKMHPIQRNRRIRGPYVRWCGRTAEGNLRLLPDFTFSTRNS